ncbi:hypothetical protein ACIQPT_35640 [Streptomyces sp. NPDC091289]|uniref:hypothetical protein n=1 Tax=Streptomyces sp. NPDC091289 TaxID=3365989 RepID=UPI0037F51758
MKLAKTRTKTRVALVAVTSLIGSMATLTIAAPPAAAACSGTNFTVTTTGAKVTGTKYSGCTGTNYYKVTATVSDTSCDGREARAEFTTVNSDYYKMIKASNGCNSKSTATFSWTLKKGQLGSICISRHDWRGYQNTKCKKY